ncbi:MAG: hypothetical protein A2Y62_20545 [Candidatus Fischerbacteria bacterium RBG_13_37_8]|uniref:Tetratricopeptide repeat protein n=1 Tax=Candidatus Fischerbacteria bacterium RBG_13_37_8 TaxID=1817863 RepID=A0A1F5VEF8_9BACT|nr:MAG: hypothetical protein A2Y62_20545 [Candidatus Fischerbacteria bacterium RBG_13_37_8]
MSLIEELEKKLEREPASLRFVHLVEEYRKAGRLNEAIDLCLKGIEQHPNYWSAYVSLAKCYYEKDDIEQARDYLEQANAGAPDNIQAISLLAEIYEKLTFWDKALDKLRLLQLLSPDERTSDKIKYLEEKIGEEERQEAPTVQFSMSLIKETLTKTQADDAAGADEKETEETLSTERTGKIEKETLEKIISSETMQEPSAQEDFNAQSEEQTAIQSNEKESVHYEREPIEILSLIKPETFNDAISEKAQEISDQFAQQEELTIEITTQTLGEIYATQGYYEKAIKIYQKILIAEPNNSAAVNRLKELMDEFNKINARTNKQFFKEEITSEAPDQTKTSDKNQERKKRISTLENWLSTVKREKK